MNRIQRIARRALMPYEDDDLERLVAALKAGGRVCFVPSALQLGQVIAHHSPNESKAPVQYRAKLARKGLCKGWPDLTFVAATMRALELKRAKGGKASDDQRALLEYLAACGWETALCAGYDAAAEQCRAWGLLP